MSALCPSFLVVICMVAPHALSAAGAAAAGDFLAKLASGIQDAVSWIFTNTTTLWLRIPSPDLANEPAITAIRQWLLPVTAAVAVGGMIAAGLRMVLTRRANPLLDVGTGLAAIAAAATLGVAVPDLLLQAGDAWTGWVLNVSAGGQLSGRLGDILTAGSAPAVIVIVFGLLALVMGAMQAALLVFRQAAVIILAALLPLAAAGAIAPLTRAWIRKIISWMLALIAYKPAAAAVYAAAFTMIGKGRNLQTLLMGFVMLALSLLALPVLMRFFTWTTGAVASSGSTGALLGGAAAGMAAMGSLRGTSGGSGGSSAGEHASYLASQQQSQAGGAASGAGGLAASGSSEAGSGGPGGGQDQAAGDPARAAAGASTAGGRAAAGSAAASAGDAGPPDRAGAAGAGHAGGAAGVSAGPAGMAGGAAAGAQGAGTAAGSASTAGAGAAAAATGGLAGVLTTAAQAAQGLADGARESAGTAMEEGEQR
jgi:hypothetical protein